jgi:hypothetical protein
MSRCSASLPSLDADVGGVQAGGWPLPENRLGRVATRLINEARHRWRFAHVRCEMPIDLEQMRKASVRDVWKHEEQGFVSMDANGGRKAWTAAFGSPETEGVAS